MTISRRAFTGGALSFAFGSQLALPAFAQSPPNLAAALSAIRAYGEAHRNFFFLPGLTLGVSTPGGLSTVMDFGFANADSRAAITPDTLFQIGSISKLMTALVIHQLAAEGRLRLTDRVSALVPALPLPAGNAITVQHLLDHTAGLPSDTPLFVEGGLVPAYAPGTHWHYSNTGYEMAGKIAEQVAGKPLGRLMDERIFAPLGMTRSRGAILSPDRHLYAQGYEAANRGAAYARGVPLAPAGWVDVSFGAGSVASTASDMNLFMRALADAAQGRGGLGLSHEQARAYTTHAVPSATPGTTYGNGLMHVANAGRTYLHHTGGMVSFSSAFHLDVASGVGAFASSTVGAFSSFRPRLLTRFAVDALTNALAGRPLPAPAPLAVAVPNAASYVGRYSGPNGAFEIRAGNPLTLVAGGQSAELQPWGGEIFRTAHPQFNQFSLKFERSGNLVTGAVWGPSSYSRNGAARRLPPTDPELARLAGRYVYDSPWWGPVNVVERGGKLWLETETPMTRIGDNLWRVGEQSWSPERASFGHFLGGRPQVLFLSGEKFVRQDI